MVFIVCALVRRSLERDESGQEEKQKTLLTQVEELEDRYGINIMKGIYVDWQKCNPNGYKYLSFGNKQDVIHVFEGDLPYDINTEKIENVYFVNKYAQLSDQEDRAETFSFLIACDDADDLPESYNSPHVKEKAKLIVDMIDDTFECVDDNAYWARMYHEKYGDV